MGTIHSIIVDSEALGVFRYAVVNAIHARSDRKPIRASRGRLRVPNGDESGQVVPNRLFHSR